MQLEKLKVVQSLVKLCKISKKKILEDLKDDGYILKFDFDYVLPFSMVLGQEKIKSVFDLLFIEKFKKTNLYTTLEEFGDLPVGFYLGSKYFVVTREPMPLPAAGIVVLDSGDNYFVFSHIDVFLVKNLV